MKRIIIFGLFLSAALTLLASPKVIILGFDGVDYHYVQEWMAEGKLPNMQKLADEGSFLPLLPTVPAQTPVSWSTFTTGLQPGKHLIFDFLKRDPKTYMPTFAIADETTEPFLFGKKNPIVLPLIAFSALFILSFLLAWLFRRSFKFRILFGLVVGIIAAGAVWKVTAKYIPDHKPGLINHQKGEPFWDVLAAKGVKCKIVRMPVTFPAKSFPHGHLFAGLGVPDLSGRIGKPFFFTSDLFVPTGDENEFSVEVVELPDNKGSMTVKIVGPPNKFFARPDYIKIPMTLTVSDDRKSIQIQVCGQTRVLKAGDWTPWMDFVFPVNPLIKIRGIGRFYLASLEPEINLYLSPINFDPRHLPPGFDVTYPRSWAKSLVDRFGLYKTIGWSVDTWSPSEELTDEEFFMQEWAYNADDFGKMLKGFLEDDDDLLFQYYEFTDRVGHIFFRLMDEGHPDYNAAKAAKYGDALLKSYEAMDAIVGETMKRMDPKAKLIVLSDHGFASFRYAVNYNTWLVKNGYMTLTGAQNVVQNLEALFDQGQFWPNVDWSKTRAYCMGLGGLYVNLKGREAKGIVDPGAEYDALRKELIAKLEGWVDERRGDHPVAKVYTREEAYGSFDAVLIPDMIVTNNPYYRVSWQTSLGGIPAALIEDNTQVWSGDHCSLYPPAVPGVLFSNMAMKDEKTPFIGDLYPTILALFDAKAPYDLPGHSLLP